MAIVRLGKQYTLAKIIDEVQVITGQLDPELVPRLSITEHANLATYEVVTLLNMLCAPWYGVAPKIINGSLTTGDLTTSQGSSKKVTVNGATSGTLAYAVDASASPNLEKVVSVANSITGTSKKCRDMSQFCGIALAGNSQWKNSAAWVHHGNEILVWYGSSMTTPDFIFFCYRQAVPMSAEVDVIDLPDKYVPLVVAKTAVWALKQANMGNYQIVEDQINNGILQIQKEYADNATLQQTKQRNESIENM